MNQILSQIINISSELKSLNSKLTRQLLNKVKSTEAFREIAHDGWRIRSLEKISGHELKRTMLSNRSSVAESIRAREENTGSDQIRTFLLAGTSGAEIEEYIHEDRNYLIMDIFNILEQNKFNKHRRGRVALFIFREDNLQPIFVTSGPWSE